MPGGALWRDSFLSVCPSAAFGLQDYWLVDTSMSFTWKKIKPGVAFSLPCLELQCVKKPKTSTERETWTPQCLLLDFLKIYECCVHACSCVHMHVCVCATVQVNVCIHPCRA